MNRLVYLGLTSALIGGAFFLGARSRGPNATPAGCSPERRILYYVDPMNPAHTSPEPGFAPCGMKLEPVYADEASGEPGQPARLAGVPGSVRISLEKQQLIGVRTSPVEKQPLRYTRRMLGRVAVDETRVYWINATVDGWITRALPYATGDYVRSNQVLAAFYSAEFLSAGNALLFALNSQDRLKAAAPGTSADDSRLLQFRRNLQQYADALKNLGMGDPQIHEMIETRQFRQNVDIIAPADGFILSRNVSEGLRFEQGTELYRIADLRRVWILADVFENEAGILQPGRSVRVSCPQQQRTFAATMSTALPKFDSASRTLKVRFEMANPDYALQPDMFVDLEFPVELPDTLFVAADALLDTGQRQTVFVDRGQGHFEPRVVKTGRRFGEVVEILHGLDPGESVVVAGTFLLDSESRMKFAAAGYHGFPARDPVCSMTVDESKARAVGRSSEHEGTTYYFCHDGCKHSFDENPGRYLKAALEKVAQGSPSECDAKPSEAAKSCVRAPLSQAEEVQVAAHDALHPPGQSDAAADLLRTLNTMGHEPFDATRVKAKSPTPTISDPVCGMKVDAAKARAAGRVSTHQGTNYYFCNDGCKRSFDEDPNWVLTEITARLVESAASSKPSGPSHP